MKPDAIQFNSPNITSISTKHTMFSFRWQCLHFSVNSIIFVIEPARAQGFLNVDWSWLSQHKMRLKFLWNALDQPFFFEVLNSALTVLFQNCRLKVHYVVLERKPRKIILITFMLLIWNIHFIPSVSGTRQNNIQTHIHFIVIPTA